MAATSAKYITTTSLLLRAGLAFAFFYASISSFLTPNDWIGYFPLFLRNIVPSQILLTMFSVIELLVAAWLLSGWRVAYAALLAAAMLGGIVVFNPTLLPITFRDISLVFAALGLYALETARNQ
jgi:hypothetical protein